MTHFSTRTASWCASSSPSSYHFFYGHTPTARNPAELCVFSQWYPRPFIVDGRTYPTAEHWMMYGKARLFGDDAAAAAILAPENAGPDAAKKLGRGVKGFDQARWDAHADDLVVQGNYHKFRDPHMWAALDATGDRILVEAAPRDRIWGSGFGSDRAMENRARWGTNRLGLALVRVREQIRKELAEKARRPL